MKNEIILKETETTLIKLICNPHSVTFSKEKFNKNHSETNSTKELKDVLKENITTVKYEEASNVQTKGNIGLSVTMFIISIICLIVALLPDFVDFAGLFWLIFLVTLVVGFIQLPTKNESKEHKLIFLDINGKTIFSVTTELTDEEFNNISKAVRD